jgi:hypothetical protein
MEKNKILNNFAPLGKRAEKVYIFWWFIACLVVFVVIIVMAVNFFSNPIDVREVQTKAIYVRALECFTDGGNLIQEGDKFVSIESCGFVKESMEKNKGLIVVSIIDSSSKELYSGQIGAGDMEGDCSVTISGISGKNFPYCYVKKQAFYYYKEGERKNGMVEILAASNYYGERISVIPKVALPGALNKNA